MQGQTSSIGSGILHIKVIRLVVRVAGKKGYSLVYELQQMMRKMDSWIEGKKTYKNNRKYEGKK